MSSQTKTIEIPLTFIIPRPVEIERQRGLHSTLGPFGCLVQYRGTTIEKDKIKEAAAMCGVSYGTFMRCVVNDVAAQVLKLKSPD